MKAILALFCLSLSVAAGAMPTNNTVQESTVEKMVPITFFVIMPKDFNVKAIKNGFGRMAVYSKKTGDIYKMGKITYCLYRNNRPVVKVRILVPEGKPDVRVVPVLMYGNTLLPACEGIHPRFLSNNVFMDISDNGEALDCPK